MPLVSVPDVAWELPPWPLQSGTGSSTQKYPATTADLVNWQFHPSKFGVWMDDFELLEDLYALRDRTEVRACLERHPYLVAPLFYLRAVVGDYFREFDVALQVVADPEVEGEDTLVASVISELSPEEALKHLGQLDEDHWLDLLDQVKGKMCVKIEFR